MKIERRPLLLVKATGPHGPVSVVVQNAETIRFVGGRKGNPCPWSASAPETGSWGTQKMLGRHFGHKIDETHSRALDPFTT